MNCCYDNFSLSWFLFKYTYYDFSCECIQSRSRFVTENYQRISN